MLMIGLTKSFSERQDSTFVTAGFFTTSVPMLLYAGAVLSDMGGYFFTLVGVYLVIRWDILRSATVKKLILGALIMTIGLLSRETVASVFFVAFAAALCIRPRGSLVKVVLFGGIPIGIGLIWTYLVGVSYLAAFNYYQPLTPLARIATWLYAARLAFRPEILIFALVGLLKLRKTSRIRMSVAILVGISAFLLLEPGVVDYRYAFILFPAVLPLAGLGTCAMAEYISGRLAISPSRKKQFNLVFVILVLVLYIFETNWITHKFFSFPWKPFIDPSVSNSAVAQPC